MTSCGVRSLLLLLVVSLSAVQVRAQQQETPPPEPQAAPVQPPPVPAPPAPEPQSVPVPAPASPDAAEPQTPTVPEPSGSGGGTESGTGDVELPPRPAEDRILPRLDFYFPEGELDLRVNRLINKTFFEGQVKYNFIKGDITAFLRYRYYGYQRTTQFTVFDAIEFDDIDQNVTDDFDRVRGTLLLLQWPHSYNSRTFGLAEIDRISSNKGERGSDFFVRRDRTNTFVRMGYQLGTPDEGRSSAIAGETRARTERLFSAFREFGPGDATITAAFTYGFKFGIGDFDYLKFEFEALKRFDVSTRTFLIGRLRGGTFPYIGKVDDPETLPPDPEPLDFYAIPGSEAFHLEGRENLKGLGDRQRGIEQLLTTWEYFFPWFLESHHNFLRLDFQNWYWILYTGIGTTGLDREAYTDFDSYIPDAGIGFESSFRLRKYRFFLSGIVAQALKGDGGVEARISVKSYR
ncbi:MAG TPA: hypothetical protein VHC97_06805 [Thermoanaerobaculia bacterium]|jgi:hypothetical protein|nr:hypothetical protein [Thermoanaerobaculia bacterium]